jgi:hypothetical protein
LPYLCFSLLTYVSKSINLQMHFSSPAYPCYRLTILVISALSEALFISTYFTCSSYHAKNWSQFGPSHHWNAKGSKFLSSNDTVSSFVFLWKVNEARSYKDFYENQSLLKVLKICYLYAVHTVHPLPKAVLMNER